MQLGVCNSLSYLSLNRSLLWRVEIFSMFQERIGSVKYLPEFLEMVQSLCLIDH